jgi:hypothetical protein
LLESVQQEGVWVQELDTECGEFADAKVADVLGDEADRVRVAIQVVGQDGLGAGGNVGILDGARRWCNAGELCLAARMSSSCRFADAASGLRPVATSARLSSSRIKGLQCRRMRPW